MPELAEVDYYRKRWNPGLKQRIESVELHGGKRIFRGINLGEFEKALTGAALERYTESRRAHLAYYQLATRWLTPFSARSVRAISAIIFPIPTSAGGA